MRHSLKGLCGAGALVLPLSVIVPAIMSPALAQQPVVRDLGGSNSFYDQTATQAQASGNLALFNQVEQHQRELRELRGQIEELRYQLDQLKQQSRQQYMDLDQRLSELPAQAPQASSSAAAADTSEPKGDSTSNSSQQAGSGASDQAREAYQAAFSKVQSRNFDQAISDFDTFVDRYPDSSLTGNAYYWLGELHSAQSSFGDAEKAFDTVLERFPDSSKVPDAMYKLGLLKARQGDTDEGHALLKSVQEDYPDSNAASLADDYMRQSGA